MVLQRQYDQLRREQPERIAEARTVTRSYPRERFYKSDCRADSDHCDDSHGAANLQEIKSAGVGLVCLRPPGFRL